MRIDIEFFFLGGELSLSPEEASLRFPSGPLRPLEALQAHPLPPLA
jgi:hypothetical protein